MKNQKQETPAARKLRISLEWGASLARTVANNWERGDLAAAVRNLEAWAKGATILLETAAQPDPAAVFGIAASLDKFASGSAFKGNVSDAYSGGDQFMREIMKVGERFETWASAHVDFTANEEVWPYYLQDKFATALEAARPGALLILDKLTAEDFAAVAAELGLKLNKEGNT